MHHPGIWGRRIAPLQHPSYQRPQQSRPLIPGISAISRERIAASPCMWLSHTPTPLPHLTACRASELSVRVAPASFPLSLPSLAGSPVFVMEDSTKMVEVARASWPHPRSLGRHRARCLTVRLPMPPVRPVRETFASYGSRQRDIMGKVHFASSTERSPRSACAFAGDLCTVSRPSPSGPAPCTSLFWFSAY